MLRQVWHAERTSNLRNDWVDTIDELTGTYRSIKDAEAKDTDQGPGVGEIAVEDASQESIAILASQRLQQVEERNNNSEAGPSGQSASGKVSVILDDTVRQVHHSLSPRTVNQPSPDIDNARASWVDDPLVNGGIGDDGDDGDRPDQRPSTEFRYRPHRQSRMSSDPHDSGLNGNEDGPANEVTGQDQQVSVLDREFEEELQQPTFTGRFGSPTTSHKTSLTTSSGSHVRPAGHRPPVTVEAVLDAPPEPAEVDESPVANLKRLTSLPSPRGRWATLTNASKHEERDHRLSVEVNHRPATETPVQTTRRPVFHRHVAPDVSIPQTGRGVVGTRTGETKDADTLTSTSPESPVLPPPGTNITDVDSEAEENIEDAESLSPLQTTRTRRSTQASRLHPMEQSPLVQHSTDEGPSTSDKIVSPLRRGDHLTYGKKGKKQANGSAMKRSSNTQTGRTAKKARSTDPGMTRATAIDIDSE